MNNFQMIERAIEQITLFTKNNDDKLLYIIMAARSIPLDIDAIVLRSVEDLCLDAGWEKQRFYRSINRLKRTRLIEEKSGGRNEGEKCYALKFLSSKEGLIL